MMMPTASQPAITPNCHSSSRGIPYTISLKRIFIGVRGRALHIGWSQLGNISIGINRLERNGVLKSWAVRKGVPEEVGVRRLATQVEDHALSYASFQGKIPKGQYGAGRVKIWDRGTYETKSWSRKKIEVMFYGKKLWGDYILRWMDAMNNWLLWKR